MENGRIGAEGRLRVRRCSAVSVTVVVVVGTQRANETVVPAVPVVAVVVVVESESKGGERVHPASLVAGHGQQLLALQQPHQTMHPQHPNRLHRLQQRPYHPHSHHHQHHQGLHLHPPCDGAYGDVVSAAAVAVDVAYSTWQCAVFLLRVRSTVDVATTHTHMQTHTMQS